MDAEGTPESGSAGCAECGADVAERPTRLEFDDQEIFLFDPVVCAACLLDLCERFSVDCANCGGKIPPYSQVGVHKGDNGARLLVHMTNHCTTVGSAFHGYWGRGRLGGIVEVEAC